MTFIISISYIIAINKYYFSFSSDNDLRLYFAKAIQEWSRETCLTFIALPLADTTHKAYLNLTDKFR